MKKCCDCLQSEGMKNFGLLVLRLAVGGVFIFHGWGKLMDMDATIAMFTDGFGLPIPAVLAYLVAIGELVGGVAVVLGIMSRLAGLGLAIIMLGAILTVHLGDIKTGELAIALLGGSMGLVASGGGAWRLWSQKCPMS